MVSNNESKDIDNKIYPCFYFDDRINTMVQSRKKYNNKYMIALIQITKIENFLLIDVPVFKLLCHNVLFINKKVIRTC